MHFRARSVKIMHSVEEELNEIGTSEELEYLEDSGDFRYIVIIPKPEANLKISIPENYPSEPPLFDLGVSEQSEGLDDNMKRVVLQTIKQYCAKQSNSPIISMVAERWSEIWEESAKNLSTFPVEKEKRKRPLQKKIKSSRKSKLAARFNNTTQSQTASSQPRDNSTMEAARDKEKEDIPDLNDSKEIIKTEEHKPSKRKSKMKKSGKRDDWIGSEIEEKKPPMKTAKDVLHRLKWDGELKPEEFTVGYMDRFDGIQEVPVFDLNWDDDIASTGPKDKLAIPEHRVEYFKWNSELVWKKENRTDFIFNSTQSGFDIYEFIERYKKSECQNEVQDNGENTVEEKPTNNFEISNDQIESTVLEVMNHMLEQCITNPSLCLSFNDEAATRQMKNELEKLSVKEDEEMMTLSINKIDTKTGPREVPDGQRPSKKSRQDRPSSSNHNSSRQSSSYNGKQYQGTRSGGRDEERKKVSKYKTQEPIQPRQKPNYCLAVDLQKYITDKMYNYIENDLPRKLRRHLLTTEDFLYLSVFTCRLKSDFEYTTLCQALRVVTEKMSQFKVYPHVVSNIAGNISSRDRNDKYFMKFSALLKSELAGKFSEYDICFSPVVKFGEVDSSAEFSDQCSFGNQQISQLYLWNLEEFYPAGTFTLTGHNYWHQRGHGDKSKGRKRHHDDGSSHHHNRHWEEERPVKDQNWEFRVSKTLSAILRHNAMGFKVDEGGYIEVNYLLRHQFFHRMQVTEEDIMQIVANNNKKRFTLDGEKGNFRIRANQGHTVEVESLHLDKITDPVQYPSVVHGTVFQYWSSIKRTGLNRMKRNHIHMTTAEPTSATQVVSGMRKSCNVFVYIDIAKAMKDGIEFYISDNGVILSEGIDGVLHPKYFQEVIGVKNNERKSLLEVSKDECSGKESHSGNSIGNKKHK